MTDQAPTDLAKITGGLSEAGSGAFGLVGQARDWFMSDDTHTGAKFAAGGAIAGLLGGIFKIGPFTDPRSTVMSIVNKVPLFAGLSFLIFTAFNAWQKSKGNDAGMPDLSGGTGTPRAMAPDAAGDNSAVLSTGNGSVITPEEFAALQQDIIKQVARDSSLPEDYVAAIFNAGDQEFKVQPIIPNGSTLPLPNQVVIADLTKDAALALAKLRPNDALTAEHVNSPYEYSKDAVDNVHPTSGVPAIKTSGADEYKVYMPR